MKESGEGKAGAEADLRVIPSEEAEIMFNQACEPKRLRSPRHTH